MTKFKVLLILHLVAMHSSIAIMEFASWAIFALVAVDLIREKRRPFSAGCDLWLLGFAALSVVGLLINSQIAPIGPQVGFLRWIFLLYSFSFALDRSGLLKRPDLLVKVWFAVAAIVGCYAFIQHLTGINIARPHKLLDPTDSQTFRATGFFSQSLTLAYVIGISASFLIPQFTKKKSALNFFLMGFIVLGVFASLSRAAWGALAVAAFVYAVQEKGRRAIWLLLPAGFIFALLFSFEPEFRWRILNLFDFNPTSSTGQRRDIWMAYWRIFLDHPLIGVGLFNGDNLLPQVYSSLGISQKFVSHAHNNFLQVLAGTGSLGFVFYLGFVGYFLKLSWTLYHQLLSRNVALARIAQGVFLAQIFWLLGGLTECNFFDGEVNHAIVFSWSLLIAIRVEAGRSKQ